MLFLLLHCSFVKERKMQTHSWGSKMLNLAESFHVFECSSMREVIPGASWLIITCVVEFQDLAFVHGNSYERTYCNSMIEAATSETFVVKTCSFIIEIYAVFSLHHMLIIGRKSFEGFEEVIEFDVNKTCHIHTSSRICSYSTTKELTFSKNISFLP